MAMEVLVVDDEASVREVVGLYLRREGYEVRQVADGQAALAALEQRVPELVILDQMLPEVEGVEILKHLRQTMSSDVPVIFLTARGQETDRIFGFELGADDYVVKPFSPAELILRVKAVLRRTQDTEQSDESEQVCWGRLLIDPVEHRVEVDGRHVELTATEFKLLHFLASHPRQVFSRGHLLERVWGYSEYVDPSTVTVHMRRLREKIEKQPSEPSQLLTVWGVGYKFEPGEDA